MALKAFLSSLTPIKGLFDFAFSDVDVVIVDDVVDAASAIVRVPLALHHSATRSSSATTRMLGISARSACAIQLRSMSRTSAVANVTVTEAFFAKPNRFQSPNAFLGGGGGGGDDVGDVGGEGECRFHERGFESVPVATAFAGTDAGGSVARCSLEPVRDAETRGSRTGVGTRVSTEARARDVPSPSAAPSPTAACAANHPRAKTTAAASTSTPATRAARQQARRLRPIGLRLFVRVPIPSAR
jgi:hypothetical protein